MNSFYEAIYSWIDKAIVKSLKEIKTVTRIRVPDTGLVVFENRELPNNFFKLDSMINGSIVEFRLFFNNKHKTTYCVKINEIKQELITDIVNEMLNVF